MGFDIGIGWHLAVRTRNMRIPLREPSAVEVAWARQFLTQSEQISGHSEEVGERQKLLNTVRLNPPQHAALFRVDEKTAMQALDRLDPVLPRSPGRAERHGFEYYRHGTLSLHAALNVKTGQVAGKTAQRHASADFIAFLSQLIGQTKWAREIHIVLDNLSAHKTAAVEEFLAQHPKVRFHVTPTYSSWLNRVEIWFAKIERDVIARGVFTSVAELRRKLMSYIRAYAKRAQPIRWTYTNLKHRIAAKSITGTGH